MEPELNLITQLDNSELEWWAGTIQEFRAKYIKDPKSYASKIIAENGITTERLSEDLDTHLEMLREKMWQLYLLDEAKFHREVISYLLQNRDLPRNILKNILKHEFFSSDIPSLSEEEVIKLISKVVGDSAGRIMPYIYALSLSTTQSRRSRAGKIFEKIIETIFDIFKYPYSNQSALGNAAYNTQNLGKKVDLIVPDVNSYLANRPKCAVITMKTTLRERWQEVAEELNRTNVPHIYLLSLDEGVTPNTVSIMKQYNITLVLYKRAKVKRFRDFENVIDYNSFFLQEIPHILSYWKQ